MGAVQQVADTKASLPTCGSQFGGHLHLGYYLLVLASLGIGINFGIGISATGG